MQNMASVIHNQNTKLLKDPVVPTARNVVQLPLVQKCLSKCFEYHSQVDRSDINQTKINCGTCEKNFKDRYNNHTTSFKN